MTEIQCDIVPYTECEMKMQPTPYRSFREFNNTYHKHTCNTTYEFTHHYKMIPECKNITRQNCVTNWETDANGQQVCNPEPKVMVHLPGGHNSQVILGAAVGRTFRKPNLDTLEQECA